MPLSRNPAALELIAIGASTGGPVALSAVLEALPARFPLPIVIVQHMLPPFTRPLARRLHACCRLQVEEARPGVVLGPGGVWIAPGDHHLSVERDGARLVALLHQSEPVNSCRPAVDVLFRSVAQSCGPAAVGLLLTGMGKDGLEGCRALRQRGGTIVAQDEATAVVWGMAGQVVQAGLADLVLPLAHIGSWLAQLTPGADAGTRVKLGTDVAPQGIG